MNRLPQSRRCEHLDSCQISISQMISMNRSQMRRSFPGKLIQQTDSASNACELLGPKGGGLTSIRHCDGTMARLASAP